MPRILSISGLRGIVGDGLDPAYVARFAAAVGTWAKGGPVVIARDGRITGPMLKQAVIAGLNSVGCTVLDADVAATPTVGVLVDHLGAAAGIQITASHNPIEWNGLKPFGPEGAVFNAEQGRELLEILESGRFAYRQWDGIGDVRLLENAGDEHLRRVRALIDADAICERRFRVALDCTHGAGVILALRFLESLGCEVYLLGGTPDGRFEHPPEPLAENLIDLGHAVQQHNADVGFAQDPDADRLAIIDETGRYIGEELTLALCVDHALANNSQCAAPNSQPQVVINASTSRVTMDVGEKHNAVVVRSSVGEANVVAKMRALHAVIGGEGNGGVIEPAVGWVRDSFVGMAYVLDGLAKRSADLSAWVATMPQYAIVKNKIDCPRESLPTICSALKSAFPDAAAEESDGLRLDWPDRWLQVRASNTEPIVRIIAEAPEESAAHDLCTQAREIVEQSCKR